MAGVIPLPMVVLPLLVLALQLSAPVGASTPGHHRRSQTASSRASASSGADPCAGSGVELPDPSGSIVFREDLGYIGSGGKNCTWKISCPVGSPTLLFSQFWTELSYDYVELYDGGEISMAQCTENRADAIEGVGWCDRHISAGSRSCDADRRSAG